MTLILRKVFQTIVVLFPFMLMSTRSQAQCVTTPVNGDLIISFNSTISGTFNVTGTFRIDPGVTVTVEPYSVGGCGELIVNAANIDIQGNIDGNAAGYSGGIGGAGSSNGVNTIYLTQCVDKNDCYNIQVFGGAAGGAGSGTGAGSAATNGGDGSGPKQDCQGIGDDYGLVGGAGGAGGGGGGSYAGLGNTGGAGGAGTASGSFNGDEMDVATCSSPVAGTAGPGGGAGIVYGTNIGTDIDLGSGGAGAGGGGKSAGNGGNGGDGGNGGAKIQLVSTGALTIAGNITAMGGNGGAGGNGGNGGITNDRCCTDPPNGCNENTYSGGAGGGAGGGGGSGGGIYIEATGDINITGTLNVQGGSGGTGGGAGSASPQCTHSTFLCLLECSDGIANAGNAGGQGGGGSGGRIKIFENPCRNNTINPTTQLQGGSGNGGFAANGFYHLGSSGNVTLPSGTIAATDVSCFGNADGQATVTASGGAAPYTYLWDDPGAQTTPTATGLLAGTYMVIVTDTNGCDTAISITINEPALLTATVSSNDVDCNGDSTGSATVTPSGGTSPYTYLWNDPSAQTTATATNLMAGTWMVTVTDTNGCDTVISVTISEPGAMTVTTNVLSDVTCFGLGNGQAEAVPTGGAGGYTYLWSDPNTQSTAIASGLSGGTYTVTVTDLNGCTALQSVTIAEPAELVASATETTQVLCNGGSTGQATAGQTGGTTPFTYLWSDPNGQSSMVLTGVPAGTYTVTVTDANFCTSTASVTVTEPNALTGSVTIDNNVSCNGGSDASVTANPSGGTGPYAYQWNDPSNQTNQTAINLAAGTYVVTITDANGCTATVQNVLIIEPQQLAGVGSSTSVTCNGGSDGSATVTPSNGTFPYTYLWDDPNTQTDQTATDLEAGTYQVQITDANGCTAIVNVTVDEPSELVVTVANVLDVSCNGGVDGEASASASGGTGPYTYIWTPTGQTGTTADSLVAGQYVVETTDANGCVATDTIVISQPPNPLESIFTADPDTGLQPLDVAFTNNSIGASSYEWIFGDGGFSVEDNPVHLYEDSGLMWVALVAFDSVTGCTDTSYTYIYVEPTSIFEIPNVFTPNGDGINDIFDPKSRNITELQGEIYNRWGEKVYEWQTQYGGWEGRSLSAKEVPAGVYYYTLKATGVDGKEYEQHGSVTLIR